jgi:hypothetical protein
MLLSVVAKAMGILLISVMSVVTFWQPAEAFTWTEVEDAGDLPGTAQNITKIGPLEFITGSLASPTDVDMYAIFITGGGSFSATTVGWTAEVDTQLTLLTPRELAFIQMTILPLIIFNPPFQLSILSPQQHLGSIILQLATGIMTP